MKPFLDLLVHNNEKLTYKELMEGEQFIQYNSGVIEFIENTDTKNYIVSGELRDFLQNLKIAKYFDGIYGTSFVHQPNKDDKFYHYNNGIYQALNTDGMVDFCCVADYRNGSMLSNILQGYQEKFPEMNNLENNLYSFGGNNLSL